MSCFKNHSKRLILLGLAAAYSFTLSGCFLLPKEEEAMAPPLKKPPEVKYDTIDVKRGNIKKEINVTGSFVYSKKIDLTFKDRGGVLKKVFVSPGSIVKAGDVLAELDTDNLKAQISRQEIALKKAEITYEQIKSNGELDIKSAELQLNRLNEKLKNAVKNNSKVEDIQNLKDQVQVQEMTLQKLKNSFSAGEDNKLGISLRQAALDIDFARLELEQSKLELQKTTLTSPVTGEVVFKKDMNIGDPVVANDTFITVAESNSLELRYTGDDTTMFTAGSEVIVKVDNQLYKGKVALSDERLQNTVIFQLFALPKGIGNGKTAEINLMLEKNENTLKVPANAIHSYKDKSYVWVLHNGIRKEQEVRVGIKTVNEIEILDGLKEGDKIIER